MPNWDLLKQKAVMKQAQFVGNSETPGSTTVTALTKNSSGKIMVATGATTPTLGEAGFAHGCEFFNTAGAEGSTFFVNEGSDTACSFVPVTATVLIKNTSGGTYSAGTLVRVSGYSSTTAKVAVKADADANVPATHVVTVDIANNATGLVYKTSVVTALNTNGQTIGDPVYLSATAGAFTFSAPTGADQLVQQVGVVKVVSATVGEIDFFPGMAEYLGFGTSFLQANSVTRAKMSSPAYRKPLQAISATIATTGNTDQYMIVPEAGTLDSVDFSGVDALAAHDSNYITFSITNLGQSGAGSTVMLAATDANTTKATGGTALSANTKRSLTLTGTGADLVVAAGDRLRIRAAATGTLAGTVTFPTYLLRFGGTT